MGLESSRGVKMGDCDFISSEEGAKECLLNLAFPADKKKILEHVEDSDAPEAVTVAANQLPEKVYKNLDEVIETLDIKE
jgi:hypothetical protein